MLKLKPRDHGGMKFDASMMRTYDETLVRPLRYRDRYTITLCQLVSPSVISTLLDVRI